MTIIETKWVFKNKLDKNGIVSQNKARIVAQGYNQQEGIDYDETYASVARLESIRILLAYACSLDFKLFQMDVKSAFLNGFINEEVYVAQRPGFINFEKPDHVYKLKKDLYGLKQAPKAWYDRLKAFLIKHAYKMGMVDNVDDFIFGSTYQDMCDEFAKIMHDEFEMSMMGKLNFFLRLQIKQMEDGIFFNQSKYIKEMCKKFGLKESKSIKTPISSDTKLTKDEECESIDSTKYRGMIGQVRRIRHEEEIDVHEYQILTREIVPTLKPLEEIIWENIFIWGVTKQKRLILPYGMLLIRLFKFIMNENHDLYNESYVLYDRVMNSLTAQQEQKTRKDRGTRRGRHSTSSSSAFDQPYSSYLNDDDGNDEGTLRASTPSPIRFVNFLTNEVPQVFQNPPNIDPHFLFTPVKPKSSTIKFRFEMSTVVD
nr:copia protein [Tanacetum cinerariifolium]